MFVDTNVLVNARFPTSPDHERARRGLEMAGLAGERMAISRQVIREYLAAATRPQAWATRIPMPQALDGVAWMMGSFEVLDETSDVTENLLSLCRNYTVGGRQIHDANIVATMLAYGERRLLTFNESDFRRYGDLIELVEV